MTTFVRMQVILTEEFSFNSTAARVSQRYNPFGIHLSYISRYHNRAKAKSSVTSCHQAVEKVAYVCLSVLLRLIPRNPEIPFSDTAAFSRVQSAIRAVLDTIICSRYQPSLPYSLYRCLGVYDETRRAGSHFWPSACSLSR